MLSDELKAEIQRAYSTLLEKKGLQPRYGQRLMVAEVARTLGMAEDAGDEDSSQPPVCVVEAGTGTGKTIAYAVAAVPIARAQEKTLVISTATVALQEQIVHKDLPDIQQHSGLSFTHALAKGRGRYLCLAKLDTALRDHAGGQDTIALYPDEQPAVLDAASLALYQRLLDRLISGDWNGDRDAWPDEIAQPLWGRVTTDHAQCSGRRCSHIAQCCFYRAREQIEKVDVIVANHDLVLADLSLGGGAILPPPEDCIFIFDEGHHLPDKAVNHFSQFARVRAALRWLDQALRALPKASAQLGESGVLGSQWQTLPRVANALREQLDSVFEQLQPRLDAVTEGDSFGRDRCHRFPFGVVPEELRISATALAANFRQLSEALETVERTLAEALEDAGHWLPRADAETWYPLFAALHSRAAAYQSLWADYSSAERATEPPQARWLARVETALGGIDIEVASSPMLAANTLQTYLWSRCHAAVVTSATLTALGSFARFALHAGTPPDTRFQVVPSPFDFQAAGELVVPAMRSDPSDPSAHTAELIEMLPTLLAVNTGTLVLFASRRQMQEVYEGLPAALRERIILQGELGKQEMIRRHKAAIDTERDSVIFGLASFAEGVDLPGDYCTHVIIAKIPFAVPDQPVESALAEWVSQRGGNPFMEITVPDAALKLVQASGRLLRTERDRGRVTLLDRRIVSKRYGRSMLDALPPFKRIIE